MTESEARDLKNMTANQLFDILGSYPYPGATNLSGGAMGFMCFKVDGLWVAYDRGMWNVELHETQYPITPNFPPFGELTVRDVHAEINRVLKVSKSLHANTKVGTMPVTPVPLTPDTLLANLKANPHPKQTHLEMAGGFAYITIDTHKIAYDGERWFACGQQITPRFSMNSLHQEIDRVFVLARKIKDHVLDKTTTPSWEEVKERCVGPDLPTEQTFVSTDRYQELEAELAKVTIGRDELSVRVKQKTDVITAQAAQIQQHSDGWEQTEAQLEAMTTSRDELQKKVDTTNSQMSDLLAERERLFTKIKTLTEERDGNESSYNYAQNLLNQVWDATGWLEKADNNPCAIEYLKRLKSKADREELLSVVCRRLCGDEHASIETVHKALDLFDDQRNALDYIGEKVCCDADPDAPHRLQSIGRLAAQMSKSLSEKTVEVSKLQEGLTNYKAQVEGLTKRVEQLALERDTERVGNKWLSETIEDLKRTTVKLPNEHTLRRLFNRHNTPDKYDDGTTIPTIERFLLIIENLRRNTDCLERRLEELNVISTRVNTESEDAHALLDEMGIPRWTTVGNHNERYLSLSARIRSVFNTHTKV